MRVRPGWDADDNLLTIVTVPQRHRGGQERIATMRNTLVVVTLALTLGACATTSTTSPPVASPTTSAAASTTSTKATTTPSVSAATSSSAKTSSFDTLPVGYSYAYLYKLTKVAGRWSVVLDPVTMCMYPSTDPNCADITCLLYTSPSPRD